MPALIIETTSAVLPDGTEIHQAWTSRSGLSVMTCWSDLPDEALVHLGSDMTTDADDELNEYLIWAQEHGYPCDFLTFEGPAPAEPDRELVMVTR